MHDSKSPAAAAHKQLGGMLSNDQHANLMRRAEAVASSVHQAWMHFQVLHGMQEAASQNPDCLSLHPLAIDAIYRAVFEALHVTVGQITDTTPGSESLHTLVKMARRYPIDRATINVIEKILAKTRARDDSALHRMDRWRNKHVAHRTLEASKPEFYAENKLHLTDVEQAIATLDGALSDIAEAILGFRFELRSSTEKVSPSCKSLLFGAAPTR